MTDTPNSPAPTGEASREKDASIHQQRQTHAVLTQNKEATGSLRRPHNETSRKLENQKRYCEEDTHKHKSKSPEDADSMTDANSTENPVRGATSNPQCDETQDPEDLNNKHVFDQEHVNQTIAGNSSNKVEYTDNTNVSDRNRNGENEVRSGIIHQPQAQESNGRNSVDGSESSESENGEKPDSEDLNNKQEPNSRESMDGSETSKSLNRESQDPEDLNNKHEFDQEHVNQTEAGNSSNKVESSDDTKVSDRNGNGENEVRGDIIDQPHTQESNGRESVSGSESSESVNGETQDLEDFNNKHDPNGRETVDGSESSESGNGETQDPEDLNNKKEPNIRESMDGSETSKSLNRETQDPEDLNNKHEFDQEHVSPTEAGNSSNKVEYTDNTNVSDRKGNGENEVRSDIIYQLHAQESNGRESVDGLVTTKSLNGETQDSEDFNKKHEFDQENVNLRDSGSTSDKVENPDNTNVSDRNRNGENEVRSDIIQPHTQESNGRQSIDGSATTEKLNGETQNSEDISNKHEFDQEHVNSTYAGNSSDKVENFVDTNFSDMSSIGKNDEHNNINGQPHTQESNDRESMNGSKTRESLDRQTKDPDCLNRQFGQIRNNHTLRGDSLEDSYGNSDGAVNADTGKFSTVYSSGKGMRVDEDDKLHSDNVSYSQMSCRSNGTQFHDSFTRTKENHKDNKTTALDRENDSRIAELLINHSVDTDGLNRIQRGYDSKSNPLMNLSIDDLDDVLNQGYPDENTFTERSLHDPSLESARDRCLESESNQNKGLHPFGDQFVHGLAIKNDLERLRRERDARITLNEALQDENASLRIREKQNKEVIMNTEYEKNSLRKQLDDAKKTIHTLHTVKDRLNRDVASLRESIHVLEERLHKSEEGNTTKDVIIDDLKTRTAELETKTQTLNESLSGKTKDIISLEASKKQLDEKVNRQSNEVEKIKEENTTHWKEISSLKERNGALQKSENQYRGELEKIRKEHELFKEECRNMNVRLKSQSKHVNALETELEQKDKLIHRKESARQAAVDAMQRTQSEYQELSVRLHDIQSLQLQLQQEKAANHTANEQLISLRELLSGTEAMQKNVHVWWEEYKTAMNERMLEKADYERCRTKLQSVESELLYTKDERDSLKERIRTYEVSNVKLNEHQHNLTTNLQNQVCQIANLSEEVKNRREAMETYRREMEKQKERSFELEKSLLKAESQIEGLKRDLSDREKEILMLRSHFSDHSDQGDDDGEDGGTSNSPGYGNQNDTTRNEGQAGLFSSRPSSTVHHRPPATQNSSGPQGQQNQQTTTPSIFGSPAQIFAPPAANNSISPEQRFPGATVRPSLFSSPGIPASFIFSGNNNETMQGSTIFTSTPNNQA